MWNYVVIEGELNLSHLVCGEMTLSHLIDGVIDKVIAIDSGQRPHYQGDYIITPLVNDQVILETQGKLMDDDVTVLRVPYLETSNPAGGNTAYIGEHV